MVELGHGLKVAGSARVPLPVLAVGVQVVLSRVRVERVGVEVPRAARIGLQALGIGMGVRAEMLSRVELTEVIAEVEVEMVSRVRLKEVMAGVGVEGTRSARARAQVHAVGVEVWVQVRGSPRVLMQLRRMLAGWLLSEIRGQVLSRSSVREVKVFAGVGVGAVLGSRQSPCHV